MKKIILLISIFVSQAVFAQGDIDVTIDSIGNVARSTVLEVCGKATSKSGKWPLIISLVHGDSTYSTMTDLSGKYCQLVARQTYDGNVTVTASSMDKAAQTTVISNLKDQ